MGWVSAPFRNTLGKSAFLLRFEWAQVTESAFDRTIVAVMPAKMSSDQAARGVGTGKVMEVSLNTWKSTQTRAKRCEKVAKITSKWRLWGSFGASRGPKSHPKGVRTAKSGLGQSRRRGQDSHFEVFWETL